MVSPKKHLGYDLATVFSPGMVIPNGEAPYLEFGRFFVLPPKKQKEPNKERWEIDSIRMVRVKTTLSLAQRPLFLGRLKNLFVLGVVSFNRVFKDGETEFIPQKKQKTLPNFRLDVSIQRQQTGMLVVSDFLWRSVVQQGWVLRLDLVLYKKRCLVQLWWICR